MSELKCGGHCCEGFYTSYSLKEWRLGAEASIRGDKTWVDDNGKEWSIDDHQRVQFPMILDMLIELDNPDKTIDESGRLNTDNYYTCKHFNKETRLCMNYDKRPDMCKYYPENTGKSCSYKNCQCK